MKKLTALWCRVFGHSFSRVALLVFQIKTNARNAHVGIETAEIKCRVCGQVFVHKDSTQAERPQYIQLTEPAMKKCGHNDPPTSPRPAPSSPQPPAR